VSRTVKSASLGLILAACGGEGPIDTVDRGTFEPATWPEMNERPSRPALGARTSRLEVAAAPRPTFDPSTLFVIEGDSTMISGIDGALGIRFDLERNDLAAVTAWIQEVAGNRYGANVDREAMIVLFTTFEDVGAAGPAYYVPFLVETEGLGRPLVDQRAMFGAPSFIGVANMKRFGSPGAGLMLPRLLHETSHRDLAYLQAEIDGSTIAIPLLGRQGAHWSAALETGGSVLGGHGFVDAEAGELIVAKVDDGLSPLDLYGLGLKSAEDIPPFSYVRNLRTLNDAPIPDEAILTPGTRVRGERIPVTIEDVIRATGPRGPSQKRRPTRLDLFFVLLTAPGEAVDSDRALLAKADIEGVISEFSAYYTQKTEGAGTACVLLAGCDSTNPRNDTRGDLQPEACGCNSTKRSSSTEPLLGLALLWALRGRRRARSYDRSPRPAAPPRRGSRPPDR
jgi:hypothetical protein